MYFTISFKLGLNQVLVTPFKIVYMPCIINAWLKLQPPISLVFEKNIDSKNRLPIRPKIEVKKSIIKFILYSNSIEKEE